VALSFTEGSKTMKTAIWKIALGAAVMGPLLAASASAGDYNGGGLKGMRGSYVPVPAPDPVPEHRAGWYLRTDVGAGFNTGMTTSENGMQYGQDDVPNFLVPGGYTAANGPFGFGGHGFTALAGTFLSTDGGDTIGHIYGAGVGYYFSPNFRIDLTGEIRSEKKNRIDGHFEYDRTAPSVTRVLGDVTDTTTYRSSLFMANGYYDMSGFNRFKPYVGAGVGFSVNELKRSHRTDFSECDPAIVGDCTTPLNLGSYDERTNKSYTYSVAASLTAGVTYRISERTAFDLNYRYLYVSGTDITTTIGSNKSVMNIDDQHEHYLRAGLRWDIR